MSYVLNHSFTWNVTKFCRTIHFALVTLIYQINLKRLLILFVLSFCVPSNFFPTAKDVYIRPWYALNICTVVAGKVQGVRIYTPLARKGLRKTNTRSFTTFIFWSRASYKWSSRFFFLGFIIYPDVKILLRGQRTILSYLGLKFPQFQLRKGNFLFVSVYQSNWFNKLWIKSRITN